MSGYLLLAAAGMQAVAGIAQGNAVRRTGDFQAAQLHRQASEVREEAAVAADDALAEAARRAARLRARFGSAGVAFEGSPLQILSDQMAEGALEAARLRAGGERRAGATESDAALARYRGRIARQQGFIGAGRTLLTGIDDAYRGGMFGS